MTKVAAQGRLRLPSSPSRLLTMCRSIKRLREGANLAQSDEIREAALQYVRKVSGFTRPATHNVAAFDLAITEVTDATDRLLRSLEIRGGVAHPA